MLIVHFYLLLLFFITGFLNYSYAMVINPEKQQSHRSDRQIRPVLNSIIFLLAANLVAKGTLALGGYQTPTIPNNIQGSLFLTLNGPQTQQNSQQQVVPVWFPISNHVPYQPGESTTQRPITQQQIISIREPFYDDLIEEFQTTKNNPIQKLIINRYDNKDEIIPSASEEINVKSEPNSKEPEMIDIPEIELNKTTTENTTTEENLNVDEVEILQQNVTTTSEELIEIARQQAATSTTAATTTTTTTTTTRPTVSPGGNTTNSSLDGNYTFGYGPSNGYENISITVAPPTNLSTMLQAPASNATTGAGNNTNNNTAYGPPDFGPQYHYFPSGDYGPSNGYENISIAYGPPHYQKPFFSSPEDPYLNNYNEYQHNYYDNPSYYPDLYKYTNLFNKFYNKYQYNYPSFYNNYLGKK